MEEEREVVDEAEVVDEIELVGCGRRRAGCRVDPKRINRPVCVHESGRVISNVCFVR
jgi:hypothetical protein